MTVSPNVNSSIDFWDRVMSAEHNRYHLGDKRHDRTCTSLDGPVCDPSEKSRILAVKRDRMTQYQAGVATAITDEMLDPIILENREDSNIIFANKLKKAVDVFRVERKQEKFVQALPSGEQLALKSGGNHYWRVKIQKNAKVVHTTIAGTSSAADILPVRSYDGKYPTQLTFFNSAGEDIEVLWVNYEGMGERYGYLRHGFEQLFTTFVSHPWCVRTKKKREIILIVWPTPTPRRIVVPMLPASFVSASTDKGAK